MSIERDKGGSFRHIDELLTWLSHEHVIGSGMLAGQCAADPKQRRKGRSHAFMLNQGLFERSQRS